MSNILIYQNENGNIKVDVLFEDESLWLSQTQICEVFVKAKSTISEHIKAIFEEGELDEKVVVRKYRTTTKHGAMEGKTQSKEVNFYNLDMVILLNSRELLNHAGKISHQSAKEKSEDVYLKYKEHQRQLQKLESFKELEDDIKRLT